MQRLRIEFSRGSELKYISHLDLMRLWQRALRRAGIPLAFSQGFTPHPRLSLAAPLAIGVTSDGELMDIFLERRVSPNYFVKTVSKQLPAGLDIAEVQELAQGLPSLQSQVRFAEYAVVMEDGGEAPDVDEAIDSLLATDKLPWQHVRDKEIRKYDLRALIDDLWLIDRQPGEIALGMRLRCDSGGTGRPEQVTMALGFSEPPRFIRRARLVLARPDRYMARRQA